MMCTLSSFHIMVLFIPLHADVNCRQQGKKFTFFSKKFQNSNLALPHPYLAWKVHSNEYKQAMQIASEILEIAFVILGKCCQILIFVHSSYSQYIKYCKSGNFHECNFSRFSNFWHFCLFLNSRFFNHPT